MVPLFIAINTTGLPPESKRYSYVNYTEVERYNGCRLIQISFVTETDVYAQIVKYDGIISNNVFHGITDASCGIDMHTIADELLMKLNMIDILIGYNIDFILAVLKSELYRIGRQDIIELLDTIKKYDIMKIHAPEINHMPGQFARSARTEPIYTKLDDIYKQKTSKCIVPSTNLPGRVECIRELYNIFTQ